MDEKRVALDIGCHTHALTKELKQWIVGNIRHVICNDPHLDACPHQECAKKVQNPAELTDQRSPQTNHDGAQKYDTQNAPKQDPVLVLAWNGKVGEYQGDDENVVHRE